MILKKFFAIVLSVLMILSTITLPAITASASSLEKILSDLSSKATIENAGLVPSTLYTKDGSFTAKWGGTDIYNNITIPISNAKYIENGYIEFWAYSANKTNMSFAFVLSADNPQTEQLDYYYTVLSANWIGWNKLSLPVTTEEKAVSEQPGKAAEHMSWEEYDASVGASTSEEKAQAKSIFTKVGTPLELTQMTGVELWPSFGGAIPVNGTCIYFDKIVFSTTQSEDASLAGASGTSQLEPLVLVDFTNPSMASSKGFTYSDEHSTDGLGALKLASPNLSKAPTFTPIHDWSEYNTFNIELYSEKATNSTLYVALLSENTETTGADYYGTNISFDWADSWKTLKFQFNPETNQAEGMSVSRKPLGFQNIESINFWTTFSNNVISEDTVVYIKRIFLTHEDVGETVIYDPSKDYIPNAKKANITLDIEDRLRATIERKEHPRILATKEEFAENMELYKNGNSYLTKTAAAVIVQAESALKVGDSEYGTPDGKRLVSVEREMIKPLALAYRLTGKEEYKQRCFHAMEVMESWPDWNPNHFLCVSEAANAFAAAYDLCYDSWTEDEKRLIRNGIMRCAIEPAINCWRVDGGPSKNTNNWQEVCSGGIGMAALAIIDEPGYMDICSEFICQIIRTLPRGLAEYAPEGGFPEGPSYWNYASSFLFNVDMAMFHCLGTDYGLSEYPGLNKTGYFPILSSGPSGAFNFSDADPSKGGVRNSCMFWIADHYKEPAIATYAVLTASSGGDWTSFVSYRDDLIGTEYRSELPIDIHFPGEQDIVYTRASWYDQNSTWLAYKGGSNQASHGDLDIGQFVLDMQGVRWFTDVGKSYYEADGMWEFGANGGRWNYYKKRAEAHNTLVINPSDKPDQDPFGNGVITKFETSESGTYGLLDMSSAYPQVKKVTRGYTLTNNRTDVIVQDEIETNSPADIYQFYTTQQKIELTGDPKVAYLEDDMGKKVRLDILSPSNAKWETMDAISLPTSPDPADNYKPGYTCDAYKKVFIHLQNASNPTISVSVRNVYAGLDEPNAPKFLPLSQWDTYLQESTTLDNLYVDDIPIEGFSKTNSTYSIKGMVGTISADYDSAKSTVEYKQATKLGETGYCKITDKNTGTSAYYYVSFNDTYIDVDPTAFEKIPIVKAEASAIPEPANVPENTYDNNFNTRWAAENEAWMIWDLQDTYPMNQILLSFWKGDKRATKFDIYTSMDRTNWDLAFSGIAAGNTEQLETFKFDSLRDAKYVRYSGFGNNENGWNSILEVYMPQVLKDFTDVSGHWAETSINQMRLLNLINGTSATTFEPESEVTVAEFLSMITRCLGCENSNYTGIFKDVNSSDWYADSLQTAYDNGIIPQVFYTNQQINPNKPITREEIAAVMANAYEVCTSRQLTLASLERFADQNEIGETYKDYVSKALTSRLLNGREVNAFAPKATATRAEAATLLKRLYIVKMDLGSQATEEVQE